MKAITYLIFILLFAYGAFPCTVTISNIKANWIFGRVIDEYKSPIPNARVQIYKREDYDKILAETTADENGRFEIKNFPAGKYMIRANAEHFTFSYASMRLRKSSKKNWDREIIFTLVPHGDCSGWVEMKKIQKSK